MEKASAIFLVAFAAALACGAPETGTERPAFDADDEKSDAPVSSTKSVIRGTLAETFQGELDPYLMGDACIVYVGGGGRLLGLIENADACRNVNSWSEKINAKVKFDSAKTRRVRSARKLALLREFDDMMGRQKARYYYFYGVVEADNDSRENTCLFGDSFANVFDGEATARRVSWQILKARDIPTLSALEKEQIIAALHASAHTDVRTVEAAFDAVDQGEINRIGVSDESSTRSFVAFEYGAGDNSHGAIFEPTSATPVALIQDDEINDCTVRR